MNLILPTPEFSYNTTITKYHGTVGHIWYPCDKLIAYDSIILHKHGPWYDTWLLWEYGGLRKGLREHEYTSNGWEGLL